MPALQLMITSAGLDALVDAQAGTTDPISITELGIADASFVAAPTLETLPNEIKRIEAIAGQSVSENVIHMVAQDGSADIYSAYGIGLYLTDGTLFAVYSQEDAIVTKVSIAAVLIAFDVAFFDAVDTAIEFGDATFLMPPASETVKGVAELATEAEADAGVDAERIMTPVRVKQVIDAASAVLTAAYTAAIAASAAAITAAYTAAVAALSAAVTALEARSITGGGLASGGGTLAADRVISVTAAGGDVANPAVANKAVTPADLWSFAGSAGGTGYFQIPGTKYWVMFASGVVGANATTNVAFPATFPTSVAFVAVNGGRTDLAAQDNDPFASAWTNSGATIFNAGDVSVSFQIMAIGF